jgi:guanylate kinase
MAIRIADAHPNVFLVFLYPSSELTLQARLLDRDYPAEEMALRRLHWQEELEHAPLFDAVIQNADVTDTHELAIALADVVNRFT